MTREQALQIKEWRLHYEGEGCSWRVLASLAFETWGMDSPDIIGWNPNKDWNWKFGGNQLYGRDLHNMACKVLNEEFDIDEES